MEPFGQRGIALGRSDASTLRGVRRVDAAKDEAGRILVVEDEVLVRMVISEHLRDCGFRVIEAASAEEATRLLSAGGEFDLVFTDVQLGGGADGFDLVQWIRATRPAQQVIITSGMADAAERAARLCADADFVGKPYTPEAVEARIRALLNFTR
jgi:DNA-binding response OmpR family regulator